MAKYTKEQARAILEGCFPDEGDFDFFIFQSMPAIFRRFKQFNIAEIGRASCRERVSSPV